VPAPTTGVFRRPGYASDTTDEEWAVIEPLLPPASRRGRPRETPLRTVVNAIFYIAQSCCRWRMLPKEFSPFTTVQHYFYRWRDDGTWLSLNHALVIKARELAAREESPTAGVIDSQSVKTTEAGGPRGYDAGKKINGRKRHLLVDTMGLLIAAIVHRADIQDHDGAPLLLATMRGAFPWLRHVFADGGYAGGKLRQALAKLGTWTLDIVRRPTPPRASSLCRDDGSSSAPSPGSIAIAASPKTSKRPSKARRRGSSSPASSCSPAASPGPDAQPIRICVSLVYFQCLQADFSKSLGASWTLLVHTAPRSSMAASNIPPRALSA
jgi:transposase